MQLGSEILEIQHESKELIGDSKLEVGPGRELQASEIAVILDGFKCSYSLTQGYIENPVFATDGRIHEHVAIEAWLKDKPTPIPGPYERAPINDKTLIPFPAYYQMFRDFLAQYPQAISQVINEALDDGLKIVIENLKPRELITQDCFTIIPLVLVTAVKNGHESAINWMLKEKLVTEEEVKETKEKETKEKEKEDKEIPLIVRGKVPSATIPPYFLCVKTKQIMIDPYITLDSKVYDKSVLPKDVEAFPFGELQRKIKAYIEDHPQLKQTMAKRGYYTSDLVQAVFNGDPKKFEELRKLGASIDARDPVSKKTAVEALSEIFAVGQNQSLSRIRELKYGLIAPFIKMMYALSAGKKIRLLSDSEVLKQAEGKEIYFESQEGEIKKTSVLSSALAQTPDEVLLLFNREEISHIIQNQNHKAFAFLLHYQGKNVVDIPQNPRCDHICSTLLEEVLWHCSEVCESLRDDESLAQAERQMARMVDLLLKVEGISFDQNGNYSALSLAAKEGYADMVKKMLTKVDINAIRSLDTDFPPPLLSALRGEKVELAKWLIEEAKADIAVRDKDGFTVLHYAVRFNDAIVIKTLIALKANVNANDNNLQTPLLLLVLRDPYFIEDSSLKLLNLLAMKADYNAVLDGKTAFDFAMEKEKYELAFIIFLFSNGRTPIKAMPANLAKFQAFLDFSNLSNEEKFLGKLISLITTYLEPSATRQDSLSLESYLGNLKRGCDKFRSLKAQTNHASEIKAISPPVNLAKFKIELPPALVEMLKAAEVKGEEKSEVSVRDGAAPVSAALVGASMAAVLGGASASEVAPPAPAPMPNGAWVNMRINF